MSSEASTGYSLDALVDDWSERCKRRRTAAVISPSAAVEDFQHLVLQGFWGWNSLGDSSEDLDYLFQESRNVSADQNTFNFSNPINQFNAEEKQTEQKATTKAQKEILISSPKNMATDSSTVKQEEESEEKMIMRKKKKDKVAYPFAVLKPTGHEGDVTLAEINERILRRPTRPVRHPVGEFASVPWVPDGGGGPGLSGKAVVGLTRIHTKGRGSITVLRTRG